MSTASFVWLGIMIAAIIFEAITVQLVSVWFAGGALVTAIVTMFADIDIWAQILIFVAVSLLVMIIARPLIKDRLNKHFFKYSFIVMAAIMFVVYIYRMIDPADEIVVFEPEKNIIFYMLQLSKGVR